MLMNCLDAFAEMPTQMIGRPIFLKQTSYKMFAPAALSIANTIADLPFGAIRIFVFDVLVYFMTDLYRSGAAFWTFHLLIYVAFLTMQGMGIRMFSDYPSDAGSHRFLQDDRCHLSQLRFRVPNC